VVPEDVAHGNVTLKLAQVPFEKAVSQVARQIHRKWDEIYALQSTRGPVVVRNSQATPVIQTAALPGDTNPPPIMPVQTDSKPQPQIQRPPPEKQLEAFFSTMTPEERQKAEQQIAAAQELQSLPPAERQQKMQQMAAEASQASLADQEERVQERLRNGTVEQRVERDRQQYQRRQQKLGKQ